MMNRSNGRLSEQIRPISFELNVAPHASGSVLVSMGNTRVICGVMIEETVPRWMKEQSVTGGWLTARVAAASLRQPDDAMTRAKLATVRFYAEHFLARAPAYLPAIAGGATVIDFDPELF